MVCPHSLQMGCQPRLHQFCSHLVIYTDFLCHPGSRTRQEDTFELALKENKLLHLKFNRYLHTPELGVGMKFDHLLLQLWLILYNRPPTSPSTFFLRQTVQIQGYVCPIALISLTDDILLTPNTYICGMNQ